MGLECEILAEYSLKEERNFYEAEVAIDIDEMSNSVLSGKLGASFKRKKNKRVTFLEVSWKLTVKRPKNYFLIRADDP